MMKNQKEVDWHEEYDMMMPFCPYCNEPAYEKDHCVFCKRKFIMTAKPKGHEDIVVKYKDIIITQVYGSWGVYVEQNGKLLMHAICKGRMSEEELICLAKGCEHGCKRKNTKGNE